ncbi:unnamed protein product, partial [marine sediment metagenome]
MLTTRSVVTAAIAIAIVSIIAASLPLLQSPGSAGLGSDSFGTRAHGHRALFEVLTELGIPARRSLGPPTDVLGTSTTLVFLGAHPGLIQVEPAYLRQVAQWVRGGGRVVVAPAGSGHQRTCRG